MAKSESHGLELPTSVGVETTIFIICQLPLTFQGGNYCWIEPENLISVSYCVRRNLLKTFVLKYDQETFILHRFYFTQLFLYYTENL